MDWARARARARGPVERGGRRNTSSKTKERRDEREEEKFTMLRSHHIPMPINLGPASPIAVVVSACLCGAEMHEAPDGGILTSDFILPSVNHHRLVPHRDTCAEDARR